MENKITDNEHGNRLVKTTFYVTYFSINYRYHNFH